MFETMTSAFVDEFPELLKNRKMLFTALFCFIEFLLGIPCIMQVRIVYCKISLVLNIYTLILKQEGLYVLTLFKSKPPEYIAPSKLSFDYYVYIFYIVLYANCKTDDHWRCSKSTQFLRIASFVNREISKNCYIQKCLWHPYQELLLVQY